MGDEAVEKSAGKKTTTEDDIDKIERDLSAIKINSDVPLTVRRMIHLGSEYGLYVAHNETPRGATSVEPLGFNFLKAWSLEIFSDKMGEDFLHQNKDVDPPQSESTSLKETVKEVRATPKCGWPAPAVVDVVKKVLEGDGGACRPAAVFILAACCRSEGPARAKAYSFVKELSSPEDLLLFIKYAMDLTTKHRGWGAGLRRAVKSWYVDRFGPLELAEHITRVRQRHSWYHKDVLKQIHIKSKDPVQEIVLTYAMFGVEKASEKLKCVPEDDSMKIEAQHVMAYLEAADKLRKLRIPKGNDGECAQVKEAVDLIKAHKFTIEHCDDTMHAAPKIWEAVLGHMAISQLLAYLPTLRFNRIVKTGCELTKIILHNLKHTLEALTKNSGDKVLPPLSPALVLISMQTYRRKNSELPTKLWFRTHTLLKELTGQAPQHSDSAQAATGEPAVKTEGNTGRISSERRHLRTLKDLSKPSTKVLELLGKILVASIKNLLPTRKRFIFGVGNIKDKLRCVANPYVASVEAAALIYMCLEAAEGSEAVTGYSVPTVGQPCRKMRNAGFSLSYCVREIMQGMSTEAIVMDHWVDWLCQEKCVADVIVLMTDEVFAENGTGKRLSSALTNYRKNLKLSKVKLVIVSLASEKFPRIQQMKEDYVLMIYGFDPHLPFIIQRFARDEF